MTLFSRLTRTVFLVFLSQQFLFDTNTRSPNTVDAAYFNFQQTNIIPSCEDHGISDGEELEVDCVDYCYPYTAETFDYADAEEDPSFVIRNTVCRCYENGLSPAAPKEKTFECWSKKEVWDMTKPLMKCEEQYGIISVTTCLDFCKRIDPLAYFYQGFVGSSVCQCGSIDVCSDNTSTSSAATSSATTVLIAVTLAVGSVLTQWS